MNQDDMSTSRMRRERATMHKTCPILFHPDYTVGPGISPDLLTSLL
jgi:hypothetical protein